MRARSFAMLGSFTWEVKKRTLDPVQRKKRGTVLMLPYGANPTGPASERPRQWFVRALY